MAPSMYTAFNDNYFMQQLYPGKVAIVRAMVVTLSSDVYNDTSSSDHVPTRCFRFKLGNVQLTSCENYNELLNKDTQEVYLSLRQVYVIIDPATKQKISLHSFQRLLQNEAHGPRLVVAVETFNPNAFVTSRTVLKDHIDENGHMNFSWYFPLSFDCLQEVLRGNFASFPREKGVCIKEFCILYQSECIFGDVIDFFIWWDSNTNYFHIQWRNKDKDVAYVKITLFYATTKSSI